MMQLGVWLRHAQTRLREQNRDAPRLTATLLAGHVLGFVRPYALTHADRDLAPADLARLEAALRRRLHGEPLAYILEQREFYGRSFQVSPATLIPRPETEHLVEAALALCPQPAVRFADLGTGSGCIAVTLTAERPGWRGLAVDISAPALAVARANATRHHVAGRVLCVRADMHQAALAPAGLDLIVSNPPYVSRAEYRALTPEVLHEPEGALVPMTLAPDSPAGLESLQQLIRVAEQALVPGGVLCLEHGWSQAEALGVLFLSHIWSEHRVIQDYSRKNRVIVARRVVA